MLKVKAAKLGKSHKNKECINPKHFSTETGSKVCKMFEVIQRSHESIIISAHSQSAAEGTLLGLIMSAC